MDHKFKANIAIFREAKFLSARTLYADATINGVRLLATRKGTTSLLRPSHTASQSRVASMGVSETAHVEAMWSRTALNAGQKICNVEHVDG